MLTSHPIGFNTKLMAQHIGVDRFSDVPRSSWGKLFRFSFFSLSIVTIEGLLYSLNEIKLALSPLYL